MLNVYVDIKDGLWFYYCADKYGYNVKVEGFKTHIVAVDHAKSVFGDKVNIIYK